MNFIIRAPRQRRPHVSAPRDASSSSSQGRSKSELQGSGDDGGRGAVVSDRRDAAAPADALGGWHGGELHPAHPRAA